MARREGQDRGVARREDLGLRRRHDELVRDLVGELSAVEGGQDDVVADGQLVDAEERRAVGGPVAGDADVAVLPRQRGVRVVARPLLQVVDADAGHHDPVQPDRRRLQAGDGIALGAAARSGRRRRRGRGRRGRRARLAGRGRGGRGGRRRRGDHVVELLLEVVLGLAGLDAGAPELVADEGQQEEPGGDEHPPDAAHPPPPVPAPVVRPDGDVAPARGRSAVALITHSGEPIGSFRRRPVAGRSAGRAACIVAPRGRSVPWAAAYGAGGPPPRRRRGARPLPGPGRRQPRRRARRDRPRCGAERRRQDHAAALLRRPAAGQPGRGRRARRRPDRRPPRRPVPRRACSATPTASTTT